MNWIYLDYWQSVSGKELDYLIPVGINTEVQLITPDNILTNRLYISVCCNFSVFNRYSLIIYILVPAVCSSLPSVYKWVSCSQLFEAYELHRH